MKFLSLSGAYSLREVALAMIEILCMSSGASTLSFEDVITIAIHVSGFSLCDFRDRSNDLETSAD